MLGAFIPFVVWNTVGSLARRLLGFHSYRRSKKPADARWSGGIQAAPSRAGRQTGLLLPQSESDGSRDADVEMHFKSPADVFATSLEKKTVLHVGFFFFKLSNLLKPIWIHSRNAKTSFGPTV